MKIYRHMSPVTHNLERCVGPERCKFGSGDGDPAPHYELKGSTVYRLDSDGNPSAEGLSSHSEVERYNSELHEASLSRVANYAKMNDLLDVDDDIVSADASLQATRDRVPELIAERKFSEAMEILDKAEADLKYAYDDWDNSESDDEEIWDTLSAVRRQKKDLAQAAEIDAIGYPDLDEPGLEQAKIMYEDITMQLSWTDMSKEDQTKVAEAMNLAWQLHRGQYRSSTNIPYITHPLSNTKRLIEYGVTDADILAAAALHDCVEDCSHEFVEKVGRPEGVHPRTEMSRHIHGRFGGRTGRIVDAVSNEETKNPNWTAEEKNANYVSHAKTQIDADFGAFMVKWSDFLDNAGTLPEAKFGDPKRKIKLAKKYLPLVEAFADSAKKHQAAGNYAISQEGHRKLVSELSRIHKDLRLIIG